MVVVLRELSLEFFQGEICICFGGKKYMYPWVA